MSVDHVYVFSGKKMSIQIPFPFLIKVFFDVSVVEFHEFFIFLNSNLLLDT